MEATYDDLISIIGDHVVKLKLLEREYRKLEEELAKAKKKEK